MKHTLTMTLAALALAAPVAGQGVMVRSPWRCKACRCTKRRWWPPSRRRARGGGVAHHARRAVCRRFGHRVGAGAERWQSHRSQDHDQDLSRQRGPHAARAAVGDRRRAERQHQRSGRRVDVRAESGGQDRPSQRRDHDVAHRIRDRECRVGQRRDRHGAENARRRDARDGVRGERRGGSPARSRNAGSDGGRGRRWPWRCDGGRLCRDGRLPGGRRCAPSQRGPGWVRLRGRDRQQGRSRARRSSRASSPRARAPRRPLPPGRSATSSPS